MASRILLSEDELASIGYPNPKTLISENRYIQLWQHTSGYTSIRYFCNIGGKNEYREHQAVDLRRYRSKGEKKRDQGSTGESEKKGSKEKRSFLRMSRTKKKDDRADQNENEEAKERKEEINLRVKPQTESQGSRTLTLLFLSEADKERWWEKAKIQWATGEGG